MHIEKNVLYDDLKRRERESKERAIEAQMLDSMYQVRNQGPDISKQARSHSGQAAFSRVLHVKARQQATKQPSNVAAQATNSVHQGPLLLRSAVSASTST